MRIVLIGASPAAIEIARIMLGRGHDVVLIEVNKDKIEAVRESIDCGFVQGDGSKPGILREVGPELTDFLLCLTNSDRDNILAALVGRSLGFGRVVPRVEDPELEHICIELGLLDTIIPHRTIARTLADMMVGRDPIELSTHVKGELRFFSFVARSEDAGPIADLALPERTKVLCIYRQRDFILPEGAKTEIEADDEVVLATHSKNLEKLSQRWEAKDGAD